MNILELYKNHCALYSIEFSENLSVRSYDKTTLFCPAGMQKYKDHFKNDKIRNITIANVQKCLRLNDIESFGDGTHYGAFDMLGLFSFRDWDVKRAFDFWVVFLLSLGFTKEDLTIHCHPDKYQEWSEIYKDFKSQKDSECYWTDGEIGGYCIEFYINNIEIGNIVNPMENCIDVGFGLERIDSIVNNISAKNKSEILFDTICEIIKCDIKPSNLKHGYVLRKLITQFLKIDNAQDFDISNSFFKSESDRQKLILQRYLKIKDKYPNKSKEWWFDTHGINLDEIN